MISGLEIGLGSMRNRSQILIQKLGEGFNYASTQRAVLGDGSPVVCSLWPEDLCKRSSPCLGNPSTPDPTLCLILSACSYFSFQTHFRSHFSWEISTKLLSPTPYSDMCTSSVLFQVPCDSLCYSFCTTRTCHHHRYHNLLLLQLLLQLLLHLIVTSLVQLLTLTNVIIEAFYVPAAGMRALHAQSHNNLTK